MDEPKTPEQLQVMFNRMSPEQIREYVVELNKNNRELLFAWNNFALQSQEAARALKNKIIEKAFPNAVWRKEKLIGVIDMEMNLPQTQTAIERIKMAKVQPTEIMFDTSSNKLLFLE